MAIAEDVAKVGAVSAGTYIGVTLARGVVGAMIGGVAGFGVAALAILAVKKVFSPVREISL